MAVTAYPQVTALEAEAKASLFLSDNLPDRFTAGDPELDPSADHWRVPVLLSYPNIGPVGQVGDIVIDARTEQVVLHTPTVEMLSRARTLYDEHQDAIGRACVETGVST